ncbi:MAG: NADH-quinone oxidoreductase subunit NuoF [Thermodesulfobacteriota bacterium]|nr:NADH-quinone oxidoreductase subunit NuoF [Thermodesulfobacteriota bacterium]
MTNEIRSIHKFTSFSDLKKWKEEILSKRDPDKACIAVCAGTGCIPLGAERVIADLKKEIKVQELEDKIDIKDTGCPGFCEKGPIINIYPQGICYCGVQPEDAAELVTNTVKGKIIERLLYVDNVMNERSTLEEDIPFYKYQKRILLQNNAKLDPKNIDDYIVLGGYSAIVKVLNSMPPDRIIEEIEKSKLRGRGGAGFPTGRKWRIVKDSHGDTKYVIVNCDEGDPGAFMDRALMEGNPHCVLEGLLIGAFAMGASEGIIYVREEYPLAVENVRIAIKQAEEYGLLGKDILGSGFDFNVKVARGGGAFVCGEETALIASLEGKTGEPKQRPPYPAVSGLWGNPTNINNVETWANIPLIINHGADWFTAIGTEESKGTKIFSLVGRVNNTGLVEVPMGISLRDIIYKIGGGIPDGKKFKAVQTGGPSGGCIPEKFLDTAVDYEELAKLGSIMGSGGMIVMDEDNCMVDLARYFLHFLADESCGKCLSCREGIQQMEAILTDITKGRGKKGDIELLETLSKTIQKTSLCALGQTAPNSVITTLRYFRDEYIAHIEKKCCPSFACQALTSYYIDPSKCKACMICFKSCPAEAIDGGKGIIHTIDQEKCIKCGACYRECPTRFGAVIRLSGEPVPSTLPADERVLKKGEKGVR